MKKLLIFLNLVILTYFCAMNSFCCAEEFFLNDDVDINSVYSNKTQDFSQIEKKIQEDYDALQKRLDEAQNKNNESDKSDTLKNQTPQPVQNTQLSQKEKEGFFSSLINKFKKDKKDDEPKRGYYGELPDISREFQYKKPAQTIDRKDEYKVPTLEELNSEIESEKLKQAPLKDALFLDNILKKEDTTSEYLKDIQKTKYALLNLKKCIEENGDIQRFNACVNMLDLLCINFEEKYKNRSDALKESYRNILSTNYYSKVLGNLLYDSNYYSKYIPTSSGKYSKNNIDNEKQKLLIKLNKTIFLINRES